MKRDVQLSLIDGMDRPVGPIPQSVAVGSNADLIRTIAPLYLCGTVLDVTYGGGKWWDLWRPPELHVLEAGEDFRTLVRYGDRSVDTVCFDPPYVESGSRTTSSRTDFLDRFGLGTDRDERISPAGIRDLLVDGIREACRVARAFVLVKCMEYVAWHRFHDAPTAAIRTAELEGWELHDRIVHASGGGIGGGYRVRDVKRTQRAHSYLLVFAPAPARRSRG